MDVAFIVRYCLYKEGLKTNKSKKIRHTIIKQENMLWDTSNALVQDVCSAWTTHAKCSLTSIHEDLGNNQMALGDCGKGVTWFYFCFIFLLIKSFCILKELPLMTRLFRYFSEQLSS